MKLERYEEALADTEASLQLNPTSFKALRTRARINLHLEKFDAAIADFKSAIEQAGFENCDADARAMKSELRKAEVALKRSKTKDYYKILGVERDCTEVEIRKAYRRESLKHHPDKVRGAIAMYVGVASSCLTFVVQGGDEEKFKLVVEAHGVLSDPQKRQRYDMGEDDDDGFGSGMGPGGVDLSELFAQFHGAGFGARGPAGFSSFGGGGGFGAGGYGGGGGFGGYSRGGGFPF